MINYIPYIQSENLCTVYKYVDKLWIRVYIYPYLSYTGPLCREHTTQRKESEAKHMDFLLAKALPEEKILLSEDAQKVERN